MNIDQPRDFEEVAPLEDERVNVLVEDFFIEQYPATEVDARLVRPPPRAVRGRDGLVRGLLVFGAIGIAAVLLARSKAWPKLRRRVTKLASAF